MSRALTITGVETIDVRFPTSLTLDGSDAMNQAPDYSAAYVVLHTDDAAGLAGHGFTFTIGRGTELCVAAIRVLADGLIGARTDDLFDDLGGVWRTLVGDSQLRWLGPEKGVIHLAAAAVVNAVWDLYAKLENKPVWKLLCDMSPEEIVSLVDFRYLTDDLTPSQALEMLQAQAPTRGRREAELLTAGYPAYTSSAGWLGYNDDKLERLCREAVAAGFRHVKLKVGMNVDDDRRRCGIARRILGPDRHLMIDANQIWSVPDAIDWIRALAGFDPWWVEEPTSPDDVLGHAAIAMAVAPIRVATGEHVHNRVMFKQMMQAGAISVCQVDACRLAGVNEVVAVLLLAARHGLPVCPHAGGVGLCELVVHLSAFDYIAVSGRLDDRVIEYVDHLHEHFTEPVVIRGGRYLLPRRPGYASMVPGSLAAHRFPDGPVWAGARAATPSTATPSTANREGDLLHDEVV
jgi:L-fuconate dehydratase